MVKYVSEMYNYTKKEEKLGHAGRRGGWLGPKIGGGGVKSGISNSTRYYLGVGVWRGPKRAVSRHYAVSYRVDPPPVGSVLFLGIWR